MFFCPNCNNFYTKIIQTSQAANINIEGGGKKNDSSELASPSTVDTDSPDILNGGIDKYLNTSNITGGDANTEENVLDKILKGQDINTSDLSDIDLNNIMKQTTFKKLQNKQKEYVINKLHEYLPSNTPTNVPKIDSQISFVCTNCGFNEQIQEGTLLIRRVSAASAEHEDVTKYKDMIYAKELPITRNYLCPNKSCVSYTNHESRQAVFFKLGSYGRVRYVCKACQTTWSG